MRKINWKEEINAILIAEGIKKIKYMSILRLKELLKIAMDVAYNYKELNKKTEEIGFLQEILKKWDNSLELLSGVDGTIYSKIQNRIKMLDK